MPFVFPVVGEGKTRFQPIHVEDVAACLSGCLETQHLDNRSLRLGGPQHLSFNEVLDAVMAQMRVRRVRVYIRLPLIRALVRLTAPLFRNRPVSNEQIDLFGVDNTTDLGNVPRNFFFEPRRFTDNLGYLQRRGWRRAFLREVYGRKQ
jgi:NADH dehydrogenase